MGGGMVGDHGQADHRHAAVAHRPRQGRERPVAMLAPDQHASGMAVQVHGDAAGDGLRSEEHTSELQSLMRTSYAVFCLKKKTEEATKLEHDSTLRLFTSLVKHKD